MCEYHVSARLVIRKEVKNGHVTSQKGKHDKRKKRSKKHGKDRRHSKGTSKSKKMSCCAEKSIKKEARTSTPSAASMYAVKPLPSQTFAEPLKSVEVPKPSSLPTQQQPPPQSTQQPSPDAKKKLPPPEIAPSQQLQPVGVVAATIEETKPNIAAVAHTIAGLEPMQELYISQYVKGGNEYSRWTYATMFPVGEKPEYIYMPRIRCSLSTPSSKKSSTGKTISDIKPQGEAKEEAISKKFPPYILKQLSTCESALRSARANLENLKILAAKGTQSELQKFDKETKALLDEINSLSAAIGTTKETSGEQEVKVAEHIKRKAAKAEDENAKRAATRQLKEGSGELTRRAHSRSPHPAGTDYLSHSGSRPIDIEMTCQNVFD